MPKERAVPVKKVPNAVLYNDGTIRVSGGRFSYPHFDKKYAGKDGTGTPRYSGVLILPKKTHLECKKLIHGEIIRVLKEKNKGVELAPDRMFLRNGINGTETEGAWTINAAEAKKRPVCRDRNKNNVEIDDIPEMFVGGYWGGMLIRPWFQNNNFGKRVNAGLIAAQFEKKDVAFGEGQIDEDEIDSRFDSYDDDENGGFEDDDVDASDYDDGNGGL